MPLSPTLADPGAHEPAPRTVGNTVAKTLTVMAILGMVVFWAWIFAGGPNKANPDRMDDRAYVARSNDRCDAMVAAIKALPPARTSRTAAERAAVLDRATTIVERTVHALEADAPTRGADATRTRGWFHDWTLYIQDRRDFARRLRRDPHARMLLDANQAGDSIDQPIDEFAGLNGMPSCETPGDVG